MNGNTDSVYLCTTTQTTPRDLDYIHAQSESIGGTFINLTNLIHDDVEGAAHHRPGLRGGRPGNNQRQHQASTPHASIPTRRLPTRTGSRWGLSAAAASHCGKATRRAGQLARRRRRLVPPHIERPVLREGVRRVGVALHRHGRSGRKRPHGGNHRNVPDGRRYVERSVWTSRTAASAPLNSRMMRSRTRRSPTTL